MRCHAQREEQVAEGLELVWGDLRKGQVVEHVPPGLAGPLGPCDPGLCLDGAGVGPKAEVKRGVRLDGFVQLHAGAPLTQVAGPTCPELAAGAREPVQKRELNLVSRQSALHGLFGHVGTPRKLILTYPKSPPLHKGDRQMARETSQALGSDITKLTRMGRPPREACRHPVFEPPSCQGGSRYDGIP
jgi:hypothetical protein